jgi:transglutaminase-like putative cysteine protease
MWDFDGRTWKAPRFFYNAPRPQVSGDPVSYEVTLEPHNRRWLFALDLPGEVPPLAFIGRDFQLYANQPVKDRMRYDMRSYLNAGYGLSETRYALSRALTLPAGSNPRSVEYARSLREKSPDEQAFVDAILALFRRNFAYTLEPPLLGEHPVDEFLFSTRAGFCEHFASSFAVLMRAAGIPARIVTGYQGGQVNTFGNYLIVRQADAHAWTEIWMVGRGWVRVDPTFAASPLRVDSGLSAAVPGSDVLPMMLRGDYELLRQLRLSLDFVAATWNQWVLGYTPERQRWLMSRVGMDNATWEKLTAVLFAVGGAIVAALTLMAMRQLRRRVRDPAKIAYARFCEKLRRRGLPRNPAEGPVDYAGRVGLSRPELRAAVAAITRLYVALRYGAISGAAELHELQRRVSRFKA